MKGMGKRAWHRPGTAARLAEAGLGMGPGPPGLHEGGVDGWRPAQPEGTGSSLINRMMGQMAGRPGMLWAPASHCPATSQASGLGAGTPLASGGGQAVVNESWPGPGADRPYHSLPED